MIVSHQPVYKSVSSPKWQTVKGSSRTGSLRPGLQIKVLMPVAYFLRRRQCVSKIKAALRQRLLRYDCLKKTYATGDCFDITNTIFFHLLKTESICTQPILTARKQNRAHSSTLRYSATGGESVSPDRPTTSSLNSYTIINHMSIFR